MCIVLLTVISWTIEILHICEGETGHASNSWKLPVSKKKNFCRTFFFLKSSLRFHNKHLTIDLMISLKQHKLNIECDGLRDQSSLAFFLFCFAFFSCCSHSHFQSARSLYFIRSAMCTTKASHNHIRRLYMRWVCCFNRLIHLCI